MSIEEEIFKNTKLKHFPTYHGLEISSCLRLLHHIYDKNDEKYLDFIMGICLRTHTQNY